MSRVARKPILIPGDVTVTVGGGRVTVSGPLGQLDAPIHEQVQVQLDGNQAKIVSEVGRLGGMTRAILANMVSGVSAGWTKTLELSGTGYRASSAGKQLNLALGFSHPVVVDAPEGITFEVKENKIMVRGTDKTRVGEVAAKIRAMRPADPYKAKGLKYEGEVIVRKAGKAAKAAGGAAK